MDEIIQSIQPGKYDKIIEEICWGSNEVVIYAKELNCEINKEKDSRIFIISNGSIYLVKSKIGKQVDYYDELSIFSLTKMKISFVETPIKLTLEFNFFKVKIRNTESFEIAERINYMNQLVFYHRGSYNHYQLISTPENSFTKITKRPQKLTQSRILSLAHFYGTKFQTQILNVFDKWKESSLEPLTLTSNVLAEEAIKAFAEAISYDENLKMIILDSFEPKSLNIFLDILFDESFITHLSIVNYNNPPVNNFNFTGNIKLNELKFQNCSPLFILSLLNGFEEFEGEVKILTIVRSNLSFDDVISLFNIINKFKCFIGLLNLRFEDGSADSIPLNEFSTFLSTFDLKSLSISNSTIDISGICSSIFPNALGISQLSITKGRLFNMIDKNIFLSENINYLDISKSQIYPKALNSLLNSLFTRKRAHLFSLNLSEISSTSISNVIKAFDIQNPQPILAEFHFAGNDLSPSDTTELLNFLKTQKHLSYLNLSRCFIENTDTNLSILSNFVVNTNLKGLELNCRSNSSIGDSISSFFEAISGKNSLNTLIIRNSLMGDKGLSALLKMLTNDSKIKSINIDGSKPNNVNIFQSVYNQLINVERISYPRIDTDHLKTSLPKVFLNKPAPKPILMRLNEYENIDISNDHSFIMMDNLVLEMEKAINNIQNGSNNFEDAENLRRQLHEKSIV